MKKLIKQDFSKHGKDIYYLKQVRKKERRYNLINYKNYIYITIIRNK
jgi:hypothetical protein